VGVKMPDGKKGWIRRGQIGMHEALDKGSRAPQRFPLLTCMPVSRPLTASASATSVAVGGMGKTRKHR
jgi:hypothetical protein